MITLLRKSVVEVHKLVPLALFERILQYRSNQKQKKTGRLFLLWQYTRDERRDFLQQLIDIYVLPSISKTLFYMHSSDTWITQSSRNCAFVHLLADSSLDSVWGFNGIEGYNLMLLISFYFHNMLVFCIIYIYSEELLFEKNYPNGGPFTQVVNMWSPLITEVVEAYDIFINSIPDNSNELKKTWDRKERLKALLDADALDEDLNNVVYWFEDNLVQFETTNNHHQSEKDIHDVRIKADNLLKYYISHEIQALFASTLCSEGYPKVCYWYDTNGQPLNVEEFVDRFTKYRLGTLYYVGILTVKYKLKIPAATMFDVFKLQETDSDCMSLNGKTIPTLDVFVDRAETHLQKVMFE